MFCVVGLSSFALLPYIYIRDSEIWLATYEFTLKDRKRNLQKELVI